MSSTNPAYNLTVYNRASGGYTLKVMTENRRALWQTYSPSRGAVAERGTLA